MTMIGENIKYLRTERQLTQAALAKAIGYWERGVNEPVASNILSLAVFFGVTTDELLGRKDL